jgi:SAM-dependent methyltransferase
MIPIDQTRDTKMDTRQGAKRVLMALVLATLPPLLALAQSPGAHPVTGRTYAWPMGVAGADWLDRPERAREEQPEKALDLMKILPDSVVADIGAGSGYFTTRLAQRVGPTGRVYANDIQQGMLDLIAARLERDDLRNVELVLGSPTDPRLPADTLDLVLMVDVYHEFSAPEVMLAHLHRALKPGGRLVLLEYRAEDPRVPILKDHKMTREQVRRELEAAGYRLERIENALPRQHLFIFTRP